MNQQTFVSVWDAIEDTPQQAVNMQARSALMMELENIITRRSMTQQEAAKFFGVTQPRIADLLRGKINLFSLDALMDMAATAGLFPKIVVEPQNRKVA
ncbi:XRE family transcriptional regulator [Gammaproteobacteria bacterium]